MARFFHAGPAHPITYPCPWAHTYADTCTGQHSVPILPTGTLSPCQLSPHLEADVLKKVEVLSIHVEILHDFEVVHVVGKILRDGEVTEAHNFLGGVDND